MSGAGSQLKSQAVQSEIQLTLRPNDSFLNSEELKKLSLFGNLKNAFSAEKFPGSVVLRRYQRGEVICEQGETGGTAFYIPMLDDLIRLHAFQDERDPQAELQSLDAHRNRQVLTANILNGNTAAKRRGFWKRWTGKRPAKASTASIPTDGPSDVDYETRQAPLMEGDVFGEMSCMTFSPRSATVIANADCELLEFNRNVFDQLQKDQKYREMNDAIYTERVLKNHLRRLEMFSDLTDSQLETLKAGVKLELVDPGTVICEEGESEKNAGGPLDVFMIRSGVVQVACHVVLSLRARDIIDWISLCRILIKAGETPVLPPVQKSVARATPAAAGAAKPSPLDALKKKKEAADGSKAKPPASQGVSPSKAKPSPLEIMAAARKKKKEAEEGGAPASPPADPATPASKEEASPKAKLSPLEIMAAARKKKKEAEGNETLQSIPSRESPSQTDAIESKSSEAEAENSSKESPKATASSGKPTSERAAPQKPAEKLSPLEIMAKARAASGAKSPIKPAAKPAVKPAKKAAASPPRDKANDAANDAAEDDASASLLRKTISKSATSPEQIIWELFNDDVQEACRVVVANNSDSRPQQALILKALNEVMRSRAFLATKPVEEFLQHPELLGRISSYPKGLKGIKDAWTEPDVRMAGRDILYYVFPGQIKARGETGGPPRILAYLSRGDCFGEISAALGTPRQASCIAYDHPPGGGKRKPGRVELVRISGSVFRKLMDESPALSARIRKTAELRRDVRNVQTNVRDAAAMTSSPQFQDLGLFQGSRLLLIDLDRCTRCGECVTACVNTHDDGYTRLFLDGPRIDRFLIPSACRSCLNPSCMIGCPVGSITRGENGQIDIADWCIGCSLCADQCPYDSIQMHDLGLIQEQSLGWSFLSGKSVPADWFSSKRVREEWGTGMSPFYWTPDFRSAARNQDPDQLCFRHTFRKESNQKDPVQRYQLEMKSILKKARIWLNGNELELSQKVKPAGAIYTVIIPAESLNRRDNLLAVQLEVDFPRPNHGELLFSLRLDAIPEGGTRTKEVLEGIGTADFKLVTQRAAVCDLCTHIPSQDPACVSSCPHDAAIRTNPLVNFPF